MRAETAGLAAALCEAAVDWRPRCSGGSSPQTQNFSELHQERKGQNHKKEIYMSINTEMMKV